MSLIANNWNFGNFLRNQGPSFFAANNAAEDQNNDNNRPVVVAPNAVRNPNIVRNRPRPQFHHNEEDETSALLREVFVGLFIGFCFTFFGLLALWFWNWPPRTRVSIIIGFILRMMFAHPTG